MADRVDLILFRGPGEAPRWPLGGTWETEPTPPAVARRVAGRLEDPAVGAFLFWDGRLGPPPDPGAVLDCLGDRGDLWHAGLALGTSGAPGVIDFVAPTWPLNRDPSPAIEATSWRVSFRACVARAEVFRHMGGPCEDFLSLDGAALEFGHRCIVRGVFCRHRPSLAPPGTPAEPLALPLADELRFAAYRYGWRWARWSLGRAVASGYAPPPSLLRAWRAVRRSERPAEPPPYPREAPRAGTDADAGVADARVSVLVPTLDRYPYLRTLLDQLRRQTLPPLEVIVVDQTERGARQTGLPDEFPDLPLKVLQLDRPGQCTSRNEGLRVARGDYTLFLDDDDEVTPSLLEDHVRNLQRFRAEVSCGVADEVGAGPLPEHFTYVRASDVFPTNNTMVRREVLGASGLFDLAYERGQRADGDLGMRVYLSGAMMVLDPRISVLHHHAPRGGLRAHKARVVTYASSRASLVGRRLLSASEVYLALRYFTPRQTRESIWLNVFGTLSGRGRPARRALKLAVGLAQLPSTLRHARGRYRQALEMLRTFPRIATLGPGESGP